MIYRRKHFLLFAILLGGGVWFLTHWMRGVSFIVSVHELHVTNTLLSQWEKSYLQLPKFDLAFNWWTVCVPFLTLVYLLLLVGTFVNQGTIRLRSIFILVGMIAACLTPTCQLAARGSIRSISEIRTTFREMEKAICVPVALNDPYDSSLRTHAGVVLFAATIEHYPFLAPWERRSAQQRTQANLAALSKVIDAAERSDAQRFGDNLRLKLLERNEYHIQYQLVNNTNQSFGFHGYSTQDPWISIRCATKFGWACISSGGGCGVGAKEFYVDPGEEITFEVSSARSWGFEERDVRVGIRMTDFRAGSRFVLWSH